MLLRSPLPRLGVLLVLLAACSGDKDGGDVGGDHGGDHGGDSGGGGETGLPPSDGLETVPGTSDPWQREVVETPGSVSFHELLPHPAPGGGPEWIELYNPMALDTDLSGWRLDGGLSFTFPEGTVIPAGGFRVVSADPAALAAAGGPTGALGPWTGELDDAGERVELWSIGGRRIDSLRYGTGGPGEASLWPVGASGTGLSLAKLRAEGASDAAEGWTVSTQRGGTPGRANGVDPDAPPTLVELLPLHSPWRYDDSGAPAEGWQDPDFDDSAWAEGEAVFHAGSAATDQPATIQVTADNYYAVYLGEADGTDLRLVAGDSDGDWTTVEAFDVEVTPRDHLFLAAWEATGDSGSPQMLIAQAELPDDLVGTSAVDFEWVLGPTGANPGVIPPAPPPDEAELAALVAEADLDAAWAPPAVEAGRSSDPWGWAVSSAFDDATAFVWGDTFSSDSVTNQEDTFALFRSVAPLVSTPDGTGLSDVPTTTTFRTTFELDADPAAVELLLACTVDDGAAVHLNGVEVHRANLPSGALAPDTLASAEVQDGGELSVAISADALVRGRNVLAVEVHQARRGDEDLLFGCSLTARVSAAASSPPLRLHEVAPSGADPAWVELVATRTTDTEGLRLVTGDGEVAVLPAGALAEGELALAEVALELSPGEALFLWSADGESLYDALRVGDRPRARATPGGPWFVPTEATPGAANTIQLEDRVVIHEILYHRAPVSEEGAPWAECPEEWIELTNRGSEAVDLGGWRLVDAVSFRFPQGTRLEPGAYLVVARDAAALRADHPDVPILGDFAGALDNRGDRILLLDAVGNPADEVRYHDGGRWPEAADGGGSSLELVDIDADNNVAEAWAPSTESAAWATWSWRGRADPSAVGPDGVWNELVMGLLDAGEVLVDDLHVIEDPDGAAREVVVGGDFEELDAWRLLGNHRRSGLVPDPDDPGNTVLRLVATGPTEHMHNHAETTLTHTITSGEYEVSFRARAVSGSNQLHTRLYFNRLPHTTKLTAPTTAGTPGAPNGRAVDNLGPTFTSLRPSVAVPAPGEPVTITATVADPDGVAALSLWWADDGGSFEAVEMVEEEEGRWSGVIEGREAGALVQLYVQAEDGRGARSTFPAAGPEARALLQWDDGRASAGGLHNLRLLMTTADADWLHEDVNLMSNDLVGATVIADEAEVYWDVGIRTKGSERGRPEVARLGYGLHFHADQPFRGRHRSVLVDRSEGVGYGQREVLLNLVAARVGLVSAEHNDLVYALTPRDEHTGPAELQIDRATDLVLDNQFVGGSDGTLYDYELVYFPLTTDDGTAEGLKLPQPDSVTGTPITDLGADPEDWRWSFMLQNRERVDDFAPIQGLGRTFALPDTAFRTRVAEVIDVDQWLRAFALATLAGAVDNYGGDGSWHNARFYERPEDGRILYFPHDLDFFGGSTMPVVGNGDLARLIADPVLKRTYYQHLDDLLSRAYTTTWLGPWCTQLGGLLPGQDFAAHCRFVDERAAYVRSGASDSVERAFPPLAFTITTPDGLQVDVPTVTVEGEGWIDVRTVERDGVTQAVTWVDGQRWQLPLALVEGENVVELVARSLAGAEVGRDRVSVVYTPKR